MIRVCVFVGVTIDGFIAREDGSLDYLAQFEGGDNGYAEFMAAIDTLVVGRATWDTVASFPEWPYAGKRVVVLTHRALDARHGETTHAGAIAPLLAKIERDGARRVYLDGGVAIRQALAEDVVDEITLTTVPLTLGRGRPLFLSGEGRDARWRLAATKSFPNGLAQARWERVR